MYRKSQKEQIRSSKELSAAYKPDLDERVVSNIDRDRSKKYGKRDAVNQSQMSQMQADLRESVAVSSKRVPESPNSYLDEPMIQSNLDSNR